MDITNYYKIKIYEKWNELKDLYTVKPDNKLISKLFEWYVCVCLSTNTNNIDQSNQNNLSKVKLNPKPFYEYSDIDPDFREENKMSQTDTGIDCCDLDSTIVQCKLRSGNLCWGEVGTFFGSQVIWNEEIKEKIIRWKNLIIARNTNSKLSYNLSNKKDLFEDKTYCLDEFVKFCNDLLTNPPTYPKVNKSVPKLRDYQVECINMIKNTDKNLIINLPTGTGKNFIICNSIEPKKKYLILVPRIILMEQIQQDIIKLKPEFESNIQMIGGGQIQYKAKKSITICVYNSISLINNFDKFDKIFIDEAHHILMPQIYMDSDENYYNDDISINSDDSNDSNDSDDSNDSNDSDDSDNSDDSNDDEEIAQTDKSDNTDKSSKSNITDDDINENSSYIDTIRELTKFNNNVYLSATIDKIEGFDYYCKDIREMITQGYLSDYTINIPIFSEDITNLNICWHLVKNYSHIIIYCNSQKEGMDINKLLNKLVVGCSEYIDCKTTKTIRDKILRKFKKGKLTFLVNVKILVEGFDAPITQGVCFIHMPKSKTTLVQIIGRALRLHPNKKFANIILPCTTSDDTDNIGHFLKIMAQNDLRIKKSYQNKNLSGYINLNKIKYDDGNDVDNKVDIKLDEIVQARFELIYDSLGNIKNNEEIWMRKLEEVKAYIDKYGKRPSSFNKNTKKIGLWICNQIKNYKNEEQIMKNENIRKIWYDFINSDKYQEYFYEKEQKWINTLNKVIDYINTNNKRPSYHDKNTLYLASWLLKENNNYNKNIELMKDNKKIRKLWEDFNIKYNKYFLDNKSIWKEKFNNLKDYINKENKLPEYSKDNIILNKIRKWMDCQIINYKNRTEIMKDDEIFLIWKTFIESDKYNIFFQNKEQIWLNNLNEVINFINLNDTRPTVYNNDLKIKRLASWLKTQITNYNDNKIIFNIEITQTWEKFVNQYKKYIDNNEEKWMNTLVDLKKYIDTNKSRPPASSKDKFISFLGKWINTQQENYNKNETIMKNKDIKKLWEEFNNDYKIYFVDNKTNWLKNLNDVKKYIDINSSRPSPHDTNITYLSSYNVNSKYLGEWISSQQKNYSKKKGEMKNEEIKKLWESFICDEKYKIYFIDNKTIWIQNFNKLKNFIDKNNIKPSQKSDNKETNVLGNWLHAQKKNYKDKIKIMKDEKIYKMWKEFIEDPKYSKYFNY